MKMEKHGLSKEILDSVLNFNVAYIVIRQTIELCDIGTYAKYKDSLRHEHKATVFIVEHSAN